MRYKYNYDALKEMADPEVVAEYIGIEMKRYGPKISILCPEHNDRHYGSCKLTDKGYRCYSCGAHGSVIDMVMAYMNVGVEEAAGIVGDACGGREQFLLDAKERERRKAEEKTLVKLPGKEILSFLGIQCEKVYTANQVLSAYSEYECKRGEIVQLVPGKNPQNPDEDCKLVLQCVDRNPLQTLANSDYDAYCELIVNKAIETMEKYEAMIEYVRLVDVTNTVGYYANKIAAICGTKSFICICMQQIKKANKIAVDYGGWKRVKECKHRNIFGKIELGADL